MFEFKNISVYQIITGLESFFGGSLEIVLLLLPALVFFGVSYNTLRKRWREYREKNKIEATRFKEHIQALRNAQNSKDREKARVEVLTVIRKNAIVTIILLMFIAAVIAAGDYLLTEIHKDNRETVKDSLSMWDAQLNDLYRKTKSSNRAVLSEANSITAKTEMSEIELEIARLKSSLLESKERIARIHDELYCGRKVEDYVTEKRYDGYEEIDIVFGIIRNYDICMLEKGWQVEVCPANLRTSNECKQLLYIETECAKRFREWLTVSENQRVPLPCGGSMKWRAHW